jgi:hypothetical protein
MTEVEVAPLNLWKRHRRRYEKTKNPFRGRPRE